MVKLLSKTSKYGDITASLNYDEQDESTVNKIIMELSLLGYICTYKKNKANKEMYQYVFATREAFNMFKQYYKDIASKIEKSSKEETYE